MWIKNHNSLPLLVLFFTDGKRTRYIYLNHCIFSKKIKLQSQIEWPVDCFISLRLSTSVVRCNTTAAADSSFIFLVEKKERIRVWTFFQVCFFCFLSFLFAWIWLCEYVLWMLCFREIVSLLVFVVVYSDGVHFYTIFWSYNWHKHTRSSAESLLPCVCCSFSFVELMAQDMHVKPTNERTDGWMYVFYCCHFCCPFYSYMHHICDITITFESDGVRALFIVSHSFNFTWLYLSI